MAVLGLGYVCSVSAFAAVKFDTADPIIWFQELGGHIAGPIFLGFIVLHNIAPMIVMIYISGVAMQQIPALTRVKWHWLILGMLLPGVLVAFRTEWVLAHVMNIVTYNGVFFVGMAGICLVDYYWLRRTELDIRSLYCRTKAGKYYFWGGFNWLALAIVAGSSYLAIVMLNPVTYAAGPGFRFIGSSIPTLVVSGLVYYALTRLVVIPLGKGGYSRYESEVVRAAEPQLADSEVSL